MRKDILRKKMKEKIHNIPEGLFYEWGKQIENTLYCLSEWKNASTIGITISRGKEVYTKSIIEQGWLENKQIAVPKCLPDNREMIFRTFTSFDQLETVYYGLEEPIVNITTAVLPTEIDLLIIPGLAFDTNGYRLGYGGGYYDRYLAEFKGTTIALAFESQLVSSVPTQSHDQPVDMIITEEKVIKCDDK